MKKIILVAAILLTGLAADNARCENLLADIRNNSTELSESYREGNSERMQNVMKKTFRTATQAMFVCEDERNKDDLEDILNQLGTVLGM